MSDIVGRMIRIAGWKCQWDKRKIQQQSRWYIGGDRRHSSSKWHQGKYLRRNTWRRPAHPSSRSWPGSHSVLTRSIEHRTKFDFYFLYSLIFPLSIFLPSLFFLLRGRKIRKTENLSFLSLLDTGRKKGEL